MNKKRYFIVLITAILISILGIKVYKSYEHKKEQSQKEARFDHFMNYWYPFIQQYCQDIDIFTRMKKGLILDYIKNHKGRYIYESVPLYGGGYFPMSQWSSLELKFHSGWIINHMATSPILSASDSRLEERMAFLNIINCGDQLCDIDDYEDKLEYDYEYLEAIFERIDSLAYETHKNFLLLNRYKSSHYKGSDRNTLNNIPLSEYSLENY